MRRLLFLLALPALAGCVALPFGSPQEVAACPALLERRDIAFTSVTILPDPRGCAVVEPVGLAAGSAGLAAPAEMACVLALRLDKFERRVLQPAARKSFDRSVARMHHAGTYSCRGVGGGDGPLSQHAFGLAIDLTAFELDDGQTIRVEEAWQGDGASAKFLRRVALGACRMFGVVLTPEYNGAHADHLHLDAGPSRLCAAHDRAPARPIGRRLSFTRPSPYPFVAELPDLFTPLP